VYTDLDGSTLFRVVKRFDNGEKRYHIESLNKQGRWISGLNGTRRVLYRLAEVAALPQDDVLLVLEGEKDVDRAWSLGFPATCNPMGAGKWQSDYTKYLVGRNVIIVADNDISGLNHLDQVAAMLAPHVSHLRVIRQLPEVSDKGDLSDWLDLDHSEFDLRQLLETSLPWIDSSSLLSPPTKEREEKRNGLQLIHIKDLLEEPDEDPEYLVSDLLIAGGTSLLAARPKVGKSVTALNLCASVVSGASFLGWNTQKGPAIYVAMEGNRRELKHQIRSLGITEDRDFHFHHGEPRTDNPIEAISESIDAVGASLVVIDTLVKLIPGVDINDYSAMSKALTPLEYIAHEPGCHIMFLHHMNKSREIEPGVGVLGSTVIQGAVDTVIELKRREGFREMRTLQRYGAELEPLAITIEGMKLINGGDPKQFKSHRIKVQIRNVLVDRGELGAQALRDSISCSHNDYDPVKNQMIFDGEISERIDGNKRFFKAAPKC